MYISMNILRTWLSLLLLLTLTACYLPGDFESVLEIDGKGRYRFRYNGDLMSVNLLKKIADKEFKNQDEIDIAVNNQIKELKRPIGTRKVEWVGDAKFYIEYERVNHARAKTFYFFKKQAAVFSVRMLDDPKNPNLVLIKSHKPEKAYQTELTNKGYKFNSSFIVKTNARIIEHNSDDVKQDADKSSILTWTFKNLESPTVHILLEIEPAPAQPTTNPTAKPNDKKAQTNPATPAPNPILQKAIEKTNP